MVKTIITPQDNNYNLVIPDQYIGKKIEILFYSLDEISEESKANSPKKMEDFCGILLENDYLALKENTEQARTEWNRTI